MLELIKQLFGRNSSLGFQDLLPILRVIVHSEALTQVVQKSSSPVDDLVLRVIRALVPAE